MQEYIIIEAALTLTDGTRWLNCEIFLPTGERLSDVMNDDRKFLPLKKDDKQYVIHKDQIAFIIEKE